MTRVLLVSTYENGHQPLHVATPAGLLRQRGHDVRALDLSLDPWDDALAAWAEAVAFSVPMHTAMRLAVGAATRLRADRPEIPVCFYGLYAPVSRDHTVGRVADRVIAGEYGATLLRWVDGTDDAGGPEIDLARASAVLPARDLLPPLARYARLVVEGEELVVAGVEASTGCSSRCKHCPVPTVYGGRVRATDEDAVVADIDQAVGLGARHVSFTDPDFLSAPLHGVRVAEALHASFPDLTFDCTTKVEWILRHESIWPAMAAAGCLFVVSAIECVDDDVLRRLDKGHTAADASRAVSLLRERGIEVRPSLLPFTPWSTPATVADIVDFVEAHDLADNVEPVHWTIRLLLPDGSLLLDHPDLAAHLGPYDATQLGWTWQAADPAADALQAELVRTVDAALAASETPVEVFGRVRALVQRAAGHPAPGPLVPVPTEGRPRLTEPWFCCAEPTEQRFGPLSR